MDGFNTAGNGLDIHESTGPDRIKRIIIEIYRLEETVHSYWLYPLEDIVGSNRSFIAVFTARLHL